MKENGEAPQKSALVGLQVKLQLDMAADADRPIPVKLNSAEKRMKNVD